MTPISLPEFLKQEFGTIQFAITPYIPFGGIILLYGKTRVGKSPLTWEMARCVAAGEPFFGHPTAKGRVLYLDLDTPPHLLHQRLQLIERPAPDFYVEFSRVRNILQSSTQEYLRAIQAEVQPIFVIINTLRKLYAGDEKDASLPSRIYDTLHAIFGSAAVLVVHHDRKSSGNPEDSSPPDEAFSGHMAWLNDCQVGLHLVPGGGSVPGLLRLHHAKSQVSAEVPPLTLQLHANGTSICDYLAQRAAAVIKLYHELPVELNKTDKVRVISQQLSMGESTVWTYLSRLPDAVNSNTLERTPPNI